MIPFYYYLPDNVTDIWMFVPDTMTGVYVYLPDESQPEGLEIEFT